MAVARVKALALATAIAAAGSPGRAGAHVAASPDTNNRYLKATLLPDGVRFAYTVIFGERPAAAERRSMDKNGDGRLDGSEAAAFGARVLGELAPRIAVTLDGKAVGGWRVADVGLGDSVVVAGTALSVDLELRVPYRDAGAAEHRLEVADRSEISAPGEVELRVDESPGVRVLESHLPEAGAGIELRFPFSGNGEHAVMARFSVAAELRPKRARWEMIAGGMAAVVVAGLAVMLGRRRTRALRDEPGAGRPGTT